MQPPHPASGRCLHIYGGIHEVHVFLIQFLPQQLDSLAEPLEVDYLPFPQEFDHVVDIGIIRQPQDIVIGYSGLLLCCDMGNTTYPDKRYRRKITSWEGIIFVVCRTIKGKNRC